jgi:hypothetical protein
VQKLMRNQTEENHITQAACGVGPAMMNQKTPKNSIFNLHKPLLVLFEQNRAAYSHMPTTSLFYNY